MGISVSSMGGTKYGCRRMDKVLYCGEVEVRGLERAGVGIKVGNDLLVTNLASGIPGISAMNTLAPGSLILPSSTLAFLKRHRNGCASVKEPDSAPSPTLSFLKRYRNGCASVGESNFTPFSTPVFLKRRRDGFATVREPNFAPFQRKCSPYASAVGPHLPPPRR